MLKPTRIQISDANNSLLTVQLGQSFTSDGGQWLPDYPGKVKSSTNSDSNPWETVRTSNTGQFVDGICYTLDSSGTRILVMRFNGVATTGFLGAWLAKGSGYLYPSGNLTMAEGIFTWTNLDKTTSDSANDVSDSDSDGSDDGSDDGGSAYA